MRIALICPHDQHPLEARRERALECEVCGRSYLVKNGVVQFLEMPDGFYEGAYENQVRFEPRTEKIWHLWPLWFINSGYVWSVRKCIPQGATVIELGCAGGVAYFGKRYRMIGCDLSSSSLERLAGVYDVCIQADASRSIPLPDRSVDAVVSSYFWEHFTPAVKPRILAECRRILRPGGKLILLYDVETKNPLIRHFMKKDPRLYRRLFIDGDRHFGYQSQQENLCLLQEAGFRVLQHIGMEKTCIQSPPVYSKLSAYGGAAGRIFGLASVLAAQPLYYVYTALIRVVDTVVCPSLPADWARIALTVCQKDMS